MKQFFALAIAAFSFATCQAIDNCELKCPCGKDRCPKEEPAPQDGSVACEECGGGNKDVTTLPIVACAKCN